MINVYIVSGFLGAGKTTFIQKLLKEKSFKKVMLLENEFGEVGVDSAFFDSSLKVLEINNGCICCSLKGDLKDALEQIEEMGVTDLIIEPSGVGKLSEVIRTIVEDPDFRIVSHICVVDVKTAKKYHKNFKEYFDDQVSSANAIILSHIDVAEKDQIDEVKHIINELNDEALILDKKVSDLTINELIDFIVKGGEICDECLEHLHEEHEHHHHDHDHEHHHHDHDHDHEHHHHHHDDDDEDEPFKNYILRPTKVFSEKDIENILSKMDEDIIRVKGFVNGEKGTLYFNYVLNESNVYYGEKRDTTLVSVIGTKINKEEIERLFNE